MLLVEDQNQSYERSPSKGDISQASHSFAEFVHEKGSWDIHINGSIGKGGPHLSPYHPQQPKPLTNHIVDEIIISISYMEAKGLKV